MHVCLCVCILVGITKVSVKTFMGQAKQLKKNLNQKKLNLRATHTESVLR